MRKLRSLSNKELASKENIESFGNLYTDINLNDNPELNKYLFPIKLMFRAAIVFVSLMTSH